MPQSTPARSGCSGIGLLSFFPSFHFRCLVFRVPFSLCAFAEKQQESFKIYSRLHGGIEGLPAVYLDVHFFSTQSFKFYQILWQEIFNFSCTHDGPGKYEVCWTGQDLLKSTSLPECYIITYRRLDGFKG